MALTYDSMRAGYGNMWRAIAIKPGRDAVDATFFAQKIIAAEDRYRAVQVLTGVPWFFIGALHMRESGCDFAGVLHNGEKIIGTGQKTRLVPAGRGPFSSWEAAAVDALKLKDLHEVDEWPIERMGFEAERFNGFGYVGKRVNSPYVWAGSNHEQRGKYVADGVFDPNADDQQTGTMTVLKQLSVMRLDIAKAISPELVPVPEPAGEVEAQHVLAAVAVFFDVLAKSYPNPNASEAVDKFLEHLAASSAAAPKLKRKKAAPKGGRKTPKPGGSPPITKP